MDIPDRKKQESWGSGDGAATRCRIRGQTVIFTCARLCRHDHVDARVYVLARRGGSRCGPAAPRIVVR